ncbi:hypothetical protein M408DRAFT_8402 [Serendipita vermifera MAFF 305830]|uniref:Rab-GAP TBC domain-containing protein n=1 Tax=Serendipita vermifera MAFF 305830 TaxID=933852 RepID=A0A0C3AWR7_SERVB|nr:hypothetical protein M408DRAFT_8402 [Serendipita vermifera MAFF 305830]
MATSTGDNQDGDDNASWKRPEEHLIACDLLVLRSREAYQYLFASSLSRDRLRVNAGNGTLLPSKFEFGDYGLAGRSLAWKAFLTPVPPLTSELSPRPIAPLTEVRRRRLEYVAALKQVMQAPDGNYAEGFTLPGQSRPPTPVPKQGAFEKNNPLSLDEENPWKTWFESVELRKTILQDVQRTFPELPYFREPQVQSDMTNVLFLHSATHADIGYRQGMHELLAAIFLAVDYDSLDKWTATVHGEELLEMCDRTWVAADAWALFGVVMEAVNPWYEWREPANSQKKSDDGIQSYVAPVVAVCNRLQNQYLSNIDPTLWRRMSELGIEPQLYGIRWLRLLFTREFGFKEAMILWDGLFAMDSTLNLANWICVAMLVRIRNNLIPGDYSEQLTYLLRYPTSSENGPLHVSLLLQQAIRLSQEPNTSTGASIVLQNRNILNIPIEVPEPPARPTSRKRGDRGVNQGTKTPNHNRDTSQSGFPEMFARNLIERGESLGINRAISNTVSELRKNLPDIQGAFARSNSNSSVTSLPSLGFPQNVYEREPESPAWEPKSRFQTDSEMSAMRAQQRRLAHAVAWSVDALMQNSENLDPRKRDALECLSYVRDVLTIGNVIRLDEDRLVNHHATAASVPVGTLEGPTAQDNSNAPSTVPSNPSIEPDSPRVLLSKRDSKPLTGLTRTPHTPNATAYRSSTPSVLRTPSEQNVPTISIPAVIDPLISPGAGQTPSRQQNPSSSFMSTRLPREHTRSDSARAPVQASPSIQSPPTGYPPRRLDATSSGAGAATISIDPLGVLK